MMPGRASGVCSAALWKSTMDPGCTLLVTRWVISPAGRSFQSRLSTSHWMGSMPMERMAVITLSSYSP